jgi:hypothetical protein
LGFGGGPKNPKPQSPIPIFSPRSENVFKQKIIKIIYLTYLNVNSFKSNIM